MISKKDFPTLHQNMADWFCLVHGPRESYKCDGGINCVLHPTWKAIDEGCLDKQRVREAIEPDTVGISLMRRDEDAFYFSARVIREERERIMKELGL